MIADILTTYLLVSVVLALVLIHRDWKKKLSGAGQRHAGAHGAAVPPVSRPAVSLFPADATDAEIRRAVDDVTSPAVHRSHR